MLLAKELFSNEFRLAEIIIPKKKQKTKKRKFIKKKKKGTKKACQILLESLLRAF
jgi:hypothetical protein